MVGLQSAHGQSQIDSLRGQYYRGDTIEGDTIAGGTIEGGTILAANTSQTSFGRSKFKELIRGTLMTFSITYCVQWNYAPEAVSLAAKLKSEFAQDVELIEAGGGVFEVMQDDALVYSKKQTGTFPDEEKLIAQIKRR